MPSGRYGASRRSRGPAFLLSAATVALLFFIMIRMGAFTGNGPEGGGQLVAVNLSKEAEASSAGARKATREIKASERSQQAAQAPRPVMPPHVPVPSENKVDWPPGFIHMSRADLAAADISKMARSGDAGSSGSASGSAGGSAGGQGDGPNGARLYAAEWYREPRDAEIAGYMPQGRPPGQWGMIACRTIEKYHVEDCRELDESPRGSGIARALRQASWQFLVRPPRVDGKPMIGAWVRIRFDFKPAKREDAAGDEPSDGG
ncbi:hypothetical protein [Novosphingobium sp. LASN5T]|uniref:hypothetical protein n=1 Tax=Novosphingobium sp. LASN5T TaxID=2491021 RepID=UPI001CC1CC38|nr:hypothetical protein [Novosphingobium sp. LASN5T]